MPEYHVEQLAVLAEILLGAAHVDGRYDPPEASHIGGILASFVDMEQLPEAVRLRIRDFDYASFDLSVSCAKLELTTDYDKRELLKLILQVTSSDRSIDDHEQHYLADVARAIGYDTRSFRAAQAEEASADDA